MKKIFFASILVLLISGVASAQVLSDALDTSLNLTTGGQADWFSQTDVALFDGDAAQSGSIDPNRESYLQMTVEGAGTICFYWKVSSEANYDFLEFYIDGVLKDRISGLVDWNQMIYTINGPDTHILQWRYVKDDSIDDNQDCGWVDLVQWPNSTMSPLICPVSEALDTSLNSTTGGQADWFSQIQPLMTYFGGDAAQSGDIGHNEESYLQMTVYGPGTISFYWKVSSEGNYDNLEFYIDGELQDQISGSVDWHQMVYIINGKTEHTLEWRYAKDHSVDRDDDCGWVDLVEWSGQTKPTLVTSLSEALDSSYKSTTDGQAEWSSQTAIALFDGDAAQSGDIEQNQQSCMQMTVDGIGTISFYWRVSSEEIYDTLGFYIDGVLQDQISGLVDWHQMAYTIDEPGTHILQWQYCKDDSVDRNDDCGWVDLVQWPDSTEPPLVVCPLSEALDTCLNSTTSGDADWISQPDMTCYGHDAAQSGDIDHNQQSTLQMTVDGTGTLSFYWKVCSEANYDCLEFYIDDVLQDQISGIVDWNQMVYSIDEPGTHTLKWRYVKDHSIDRDNDCGWIDLVQWPETKDPPFLSPICEALDTSLNLTAAGGEADWFSQTDITFSDGDAAQSGDVEHNQDSYFQITVDGAGTVSFYWKVSSEVDCDHLGFYIDGELQDKISGSVDWHQMVYILDGPGEHTLEWRYVKDDSIDRGEDTGWVDMLCIEK